MKKLIAIVFLITSLFISGKLSAQVRYNKGNIVLNGGIGFGYYYAGGIPLLASGEYFINDAISIGAYIGYTSWTNHYGYYGYNWKYKYNFFDFGGRASYHFSKHLNLKTDKLDLYGGVFIGYRAAHYKLVEAPNGYYYGYNYTNSYGSELTAGIFGGARYFFTDMIGAYGELGYGIAPFNLGITVKL